MLYYQYFIDDLKDRADLVRRLCFVLVTLVLINVSNFAQEAGKPIKVDEFGIVTCSELRSRIDAFLLEVMANPERKGVVVIRDLPDQMIQAVMMQEGIRAQMEWRRFDPNRIVFHRVSNNSGLMTEFWLAPAGADDLTITGINDTYEITDRSRPFLLLYDDEWDEGECYDRNELRITSSFLKANPGSRLNIVIYSSSSKKLRTRKAAILSVFRSKYGIDLKRIRVFTLLAKYDPENPKPAEYWFLPGKRDASASDPSVIGAVPLAYASGTDLRRQRGKSTTGSQEGRFTAAL